ncbi:MULTISPECIES: tyrosine-type recombinase/integrase [unclassified Nocardia]|uniref:tyrosine-type recombinase/integrase n=1 Tax=unclassified Nocardia TaxID=2637762 RepID=UPI003425A8DF
MLTVWPWSAEILEQWKEEVWPLLTTAAQGACWPSERSARIGFTRMNTRLAAYRDAVGLDPALDFHSLRRSYVTHLIEDNWDPRFVQEQVGHEHASTTSLYTVSALRQLVLQVPAPVIADALGIHYTTAHRHRDHVGGTWNRYAPGDHIR